jgi:hypothetical protein
LSSSFKNRFSVHIIITRHSSSLPDAHRHRHAFVGHPQWRRIVAVTPPRLVRNAAVASSSAAVRSRASITLAVDLQPHLRASVQPGSG